MVLPVALFFAKKIKQSYRVQAVCRSVTKNKEQPPWLRSEANVEAKNSSNATYFELQKKAVQKPMGAVTNKTVVKI